MQPNAPHPVEIGRYRVRSRLGSGGFATVWLAYDEQLDDQVAIKVLADNWAHDPDIRRRFVSEARTMRRIRDPRVASVYDIAETADGRPFFVMEYADRGSLLDRIEHRRGSQQRFDFGETVGISRQIAGALEVVHAAGVVHRDLKPSNVLFRSPSGPEAREASERLLLADFGMAQLETGGAVSVLGGTPAYAAPEQLVEGGAADARSDLYAAAVITYELLAGRPPARGAGAEEAVAALRRQRPDLPFRLGEVLVTGLAIDPAQRWQAAARWNEWLGHALTDPNAPTELRSDHTVIDRPAPSQPPPGPPAERGRRAFPAWPPRAWPRPALAALGALAGLGVLAVAVLALAGGGEVRPTPTPVAGGGDRTPTETAATPTETAAAPTERAATPHPTEGGDDGRMPTQLDDQVAWLLDRVPEPLRNSCSEDAAAREWQPPMGWIDCKPGSPPGTTVTYRIYTDETDIQTDFAMEGVPAEPCGEGEWEARQSGQFICRKVADEAGDDQVWWSWTFDGMPLLAELRYSGSDADAAHEYFLTIMDLRAIGADR